MNAVADLYGEPSSLQNAVSLCRAVCENGVSFVIATVTGPMCRRWLCFAVQLVRKTPVSLFSARSYMNDHIAMY